MTYGAYGIIGALIMLIYKTRALKYAQVDDLHSYLKFVESDTVSSYELFVQKKAREI